MKAWESSETTLEADLQTSGPRPEMPLWRDSVSSRSQQALVSTHNSHGCHFTKITSSSSPFPDILHSFRNRAHKLSRYHHLTFRSVSLTGTGAHRLENKQITFPEKGKNTSGQCSSPGKGDLQSILDRQRKAAAV